MEQLRTIIEGRDSKAGLIFDISIQLLILFSLASFTIETLPDLSESTIRIQHVGEIITVAVFTVEYLLRIIVSRNRLRFVFSFYGIVDLIAILPFYITSGIDLRSVRVFRLFRLLRILKILRYNKAIHRFRVAFISVRNELTVFLAATMFLIYVAGVGIYYSQPEKFRSIFHSLWWAVVTLTTVGYGDAYPITVGGRIFTFIVLLIGLGVVAVPTGLIASALSATIAAERDDRADNEDGRS